MEIVLTGVQAGGILGATVTGSLWLARYLWRVADQEEANGAGKPAA